VTSKIVTSKIVTSKIVTVVLLAVLAAAPVAGCHKPEAAKQPPRLVETAAKADDAGGAIARAADTAAENIDGAAVKVNEVAGVVGAQAQGLRQMAPAAEPVARTLDAQADALQNDVAPKLHVAREAIAEISKESKVVIQVIVPELKAADAAARALAKDRDAWQAKAAAAEKEVQEEKSKTAGTTQTILTWLIVVGVLCVAGGVFLAVKGDLKLGLGASGGGLVLIGTCTFMKTYLDWIVWGSVVLIVAMVAGILYLLWQSRKAFFQTGNLVEAVKQQMDPETLKATFGVTVPGLVHQIVDEAQSALYELGVRTGAIKTPLPAVPIAPPSAAAAVSPPVAPATPGE
jgi:hypothetical protein